MDTMLSAKHRYSLNLDKPYYYIYSVEADLRGNRVISIMTSDGPITYTYACLKENWRDNYIWPDAVLVWFGFTIGEQTTIQEPSSNRGYTV